MTDTLTTETVRWTQVEGEWGVRGPARLVVPGATLVAENRRGECQTVTVSDRVSIDGQRQWDTEPMAIGVLVKRENKSQSVPEGLHLVGDRVLKVQTSKRGNRYASELTGPGSWHYDRDLIDLLSTETVATEEQAVAFGKLHETCMCCGRELKRPDSIARGMGKQCHDRYYAS